MKKLNSNNRILDDPSGGSGHHMLQHNSGAFTHREINGGFSSSVSPRAQQHTHGSTNQIQLASGQKLHILNQHLVSQSQHPTVISFSTISQPHVLPNLITANFSFFNRVPQCKISPSTELPPTSKSRPKAGQKLALSELSVRQLTTGRSETVSYNTNAI